MVIDYIGNENIPVVQSSDMYDQNICVKVCLIHSQSVYLTYIQAHIFCRINVFFSIYHDLIMFHILILCNVNGAYLNLMEDVYLYIVEYDSCTIMLLGKLFVTQNYLLYSFFFDLVGIYGGYIKAYDQNDVYSTIWYSK